MVRSYTRFPTKESREAVDLAPNTRPSTCKLRPGFGSACPRRVGYTIPGRGAREIRKIFRTPKGSGGAWIMDFE